MPVDLILGAIGLGIETVDSSITILSFLHDLVVDTKHYGDQLSSVRIQISYDIARLGSISRYLKQESPDGRLQVERLHPSSQNAIMGLLQELEITFAAYSAYVNKHGIQALQTGYIKPDRSRKPLDDTRSAIVDARVADAREVQTKTELVRKLQWAGFEKRKVIKLLAHVEDLNDRLMNLLLCIVSLGQSPNALEVNKVGEVITTSIVDDAKVSAALSLKALITKQPASPAAIPSMINPAVRLESINLASRTANLITTPSTPSDPEPKRVFFETKPFELRRRATEPSATVKRNVQKLGTLLSHKEAREAGFHTLLCIGVVQLPAPQTAYAFIFDLPPTSFPTHNKTSPLLPTTLLQAIETRSMAMERPTLEDRFDMARSLVQSVFQLHSVDWLHKSLRSENVVFGWRRRSLRLARARGDGEGDNKSGEGKVGRPSGDGDDDDASCEVMYQLDYAHPILVGFEFSRDVRDKSTSEQDDRIERNIYRHPDRQGPPEDRFSPLHDIYSLGVVLLEIGLWRTAVGFEKEFGCMDPGLVMGALVDHARDRLPHYMGVEYADAVVDCLRGTVGGQGGDGEGGVGAGPAGDGGLVGAGLNDVERLELNLALFETVLGRIAYRR